MNFCVDCKFYTAQSKVDPDGGICARPSVKTRLSLVTGKTTDLDIKNTNNYSLAERERASTGQYDCGPNAQFFQTK